MNRKLVWTLIVLVGICLLGTVIAMLVNLFYFSA